MKFFRFALGLVFSQWALGSTLNSDTSLAPEQQICPGFIPADLQEEPGLKIHSGISREQYDAVIDRVVSLYEPVAKGMGYEMDIVRSWDSPTINAASIYIGKSWNIQLDGGFPRYPGITSDAYAMVFCHEIGHFLGGFPRKSQFSWTNAEGEADYFATTKCFKRYAGVDSLEINRASVADFKPSARVTEGCKKSYAEEKDRLICLRSAKANLALTRAMSVMLREPVRPTFDLVDTSEVQETNPNHPKNQCRLESYFAGAICPRDVNELISWDEETVGVCVPVNTSVSATYRPRCWFKPTTY